MICKISIDDSTITAYFDNRKIGEFDTETFLTKVISPKEFKKFENNPEKRTFNIRKIELNIYKKMKHDLTTPAGRRAAVNDIEKSFLNALRDNQFDVCAEAVCNISSDSIELGIAASSDYDDKGYKCAFTSEITLYALEADNKLFGRTENEINFGSSGSFTPSNKASYWRTIHAASILKNWELASDIVNKHCKIYRDLRDAIFMAIK